MKNYIKITTGIFLALAASRFIPHPPNFTSLLALSFYVPALIGRKYIPAVILSFVITDLFIGFHQLTFFTWGSVLLVGLISKFFHSSSKRRIFGSLIGVLIFFVVTNFGVWLGGSYNYSYEGLVTCYTLAIPFLINNIVATMICAIILELIYQIFYKNYFSIKKLL